MKPFVGYKKQPLSVSELLDLIPKLIVEPSYYFLRWTHKVSGIVEKIPTETDFPMLEGQMFNHEYELRWKYKQKNTYEVLLLTINENHHNFELVGQAWRIEPSDIKKFPSNAYPAYGYRPEETRFPKKLIFPKDLDIRLQEENNKKPKLAQRYFIDDQTSTVQFVALTVELPQL
ncbi:hypothetical protein [Fischerella sp. JS2]|uniref:hypothetical protein n=1 Tax=Fischerella sp. JS2 TaxID=2597771 RepID=UPI0028E2EC26|nr:hypothetical protein [Fischerella sp. JS2]